MRPANDPWAAIGSEVSVGSLRARRADDTHPHEFFWARDARGHRLLVYHPRTQLPTDARVPDLRGIAIELESERFTLRLLQGNETDLFAMLCWSLIERTRTASGCREVLSTLLSQLERWHRFFGRMRRNILSDEAIRGLFCELTFLQSELIKRFGSESVRFWRGPDGGPQDFAVSNILFEIKSHLIGAQPVIMISSAEQLWTTGSHLFLVAYPIGEASHGVAGAISLAQLVTSLREDVYSSEHASVLEDRLMQAGYLDHPEYARRYFTVSAPEIFRVASGFPRMTADQIPSGICRLTYGIELAACLPFRADPDWEALKDAHGR